MNETNDSPSSLEEMLDRLEEMSSDKERVSIDNIIGAVGRRSFGPLLLAAGLISLAPIISGIPGLPTLAGMLVLLVAVQLLLARKHFWLPHWLLDRSLAASKFTKALGWMRKPARGIDYLIKARLTWLLDDWGVRAIAVMCVMIALVMPPMEFVPFSANAAGTALSLFGLALMARDGLLALLGTTVTLGTLMVIFYYLFLF